MCTSAVAGDGRSGDLDLRFRLGRVTVVLVDTALIPVPVLAGAKMVPVSESDTAVTVEAATMGTGCGVVTSSTESTLVCVGASERTSAKSANK